MAIDFDLPSMNSFFARANETANVYSEVSSFLVTASIGQTMI